MTTAPTMDSSVDKSQMSDTLETSDETTLSLPSIQRTTESLETTTRGVTIKESERLANELKTENFNLKLRIYCLEKQNSNNGSNEVSNQLSKELLKREISLKSFSKILTENKETIRELERKITALSEENQRLANSMVTEKTNECQSEEKTLLLQLMTHLFEFCQLFRGEDDNNDDRRRNQQLCRLLNSSEDLLNCASILVTKKPNSGINFNQLESSGESEDFWSEPDREESRARIGLAVNETPSTRQRRRRRNQSVGISSSLGLIDLNSDSKETEIQTEISFFTSNDKSSQTTETTETTDKEEPKRKEEQKSIYTYFASLSPIGKRTNRGQNPRLISSSTLSPDLGIETEVPESVRKVFLSLKEFRRLRRFLSECLSEAKRAERSDQLVELLTNCVNICQHFSLDDSLVRRLDQMKRSKESMEKAIKRELNKTNEMLIKTKENLKSF